MNYMHDYSRNILQDIWYRLSNIPWSFILGENERSNKNIVKEIHKIYLNLWEK